MSGGDETVNRDCSFIFFRKNNPTYSTYCNKILFCWTVLSVGLEKEDIVQTRISWNWLEIKGFLTYNDEVLNGQEEISMDKKKFLMDKKKL